MKQPEWYAGEAEQSEYDDIFGVGNYVTRALASAIVPEKAADIQSIRSQQGLTLWNCLITDLGETYAPDDADLAQEAYLATATMLKGKMPEDKNLTDMVKRLIELYGEVVAELRLAKSVDKKLKPMEWYAGDMSAEHYVDIAKPRKVITKEDVAHATEYATEDVLNAVLLDYARQREMISGIFVHDLCEAYSWEGHTDAENYAIFDAAVALADKNLSGADYMKSIENAFKVIAGVARKVAQ